MPESVSTSGFAFNIGQQPPRFALDNMQPLRFASGNELAPRGQVMKWDVPQVETGAAIRLAGAKAVASGLESIGQSLAGGISMRYKNEQEIQQHKDAMAAKQAEMDQRKELAMQKISQSSATAEEKTAAAQAAMDAKKGFSSGAVDDSLPTDDPDGIVPAAPGTEGLNDLNKSWSPAYLPKDNGKGAPLDTQDLNTTPGKSVTGKLTFPAVPTTTNKLEGVLPFPLPKKTAQPMNALEGELPTGAQIGPLPPPMLTPSQPTSSSQQMAANPPESSIPRTAIGTSPVSMTLSGALPPVFPAQPNPTQQTSLLDSIQPVPGVPVKKIQAPPDQQWHTTYAGAAGAATGTREGFEPNPKIASQRNKVGAIEYRADWVPIKQETLLALQARKDAEAAKKDLQDANFALKNGKLSIAEQGSVRMMVKDFNDGDTDGKALATGKVKYRNFIAAYRQSLIEKNDKNIPDLALADNYIGFARGGTGGSTGLVTEAQYRELKNNGSLLQKLENAVKGRTNGQFLTKDERKIMLAEMTDAFNQTAEANNERLEMAKQNALENYPKMTPLQLPHMHSILVTEESANKSFAENKAKAEALGQAGKHGTKEYNDAFSAAMKAKKDAEQIAANGGIPANVNELKHPAGWLRGFHGGIPTSAVEAAQ